MKVFKIMESDGRLVVSVCAVNEVKPLLTYMYMKCTCIVHVHTCTYMYMYLHVHVVIFYRNI